MENDDERKAYHEAGHVVALWEAFDNPTIATIYPDEDGEAWVKMVPRVQEPYSTARRLVQLDEFVMVALAGMVAESIRDGAYDVTEERRIYHGGDWRKAQEFANERCVSQEEHQAYIGWMEQRTRAVLDYWWSLLDKLAHELVSRRTLDAGVLNDFLQRHPSFCTCPVYAETGGSRTKKLMLNSIPPLSFPPASPTP